MSIFGNQTVHLKRIYNIYNYIEHIFGLFRIHDPILPLAEPKVFDPSYIMEEDVILVTLNYRMGALGSRSF